ncbi:LOW QUALITY PROTEIN: ALK tyrosine kinase receptor [Hippoglossus hippoglossus]|uniref:LOW QUALITY PROTEIN: ALK tyrosine kinase receptor n=1 Tax=Hippoglossus hippoglossus TaxID=8267 RepID=UPI00148C5103|nr:LOW QUALITY PROTEIN: ALK tyrosine kinase receptor [Hippoglossus hippoglossus]
MNARILFLLVCSAAFFAGLQCASPRTTAGTDPTTAGFSNISSGSSSGGGGGGGNSGETGGKRDLNQTINSRIKRRTLSVDFAVPSLLRNYLAEFIKRPLNGDCQTFRGCYTVRANLKMHCIPLQKTVSTFVEPSSAAADSAPRNVSADGQLPFFYERPLSKVLKLGLTKDSRNSNLVVVEIGEDIVKTGCGGLSVYEEAPEFTLEMDLTSVLEGWLGAEGGRLRVRLMPEKKAQVPGIEDRYTAAIRAADPRLFLQISSQGEPLAGRTAAGIPRGYWNFSWVAEDDLSFPNNAPLLSDHRCPGNSRTCDQQLDGIPEFTWSIVAAGDLREERNEKAEKKTGSPQGWEEGKNEGQFLWVNNSAFGGPWVLSPWLWGGQAPCSLDMAMFLHPKQSGQYTIWLIERDKLPRARFSTDTLPRITGWAVVHLTLGTHGGSPFRLSASYDQRIPQDDTATIEPHFTTNCTMASSAGPNITLEGQYNCHQGPGIPLDKLCDFNTDCPLGDDEGDLCRHFLNGSYCSFEDGECSWQPVMGRGISWRRVQTPAKATRQSCPSSGATFIVEGGQSKGQRGSAVLRSPLFPPPLRNSPCTVRFWLCSGGLQKGSLSLWIMENSTGPEEQHRLWHSASEPKSERGWKLIILPLYGLTDWFWLQFSTEDGPGPGSAISLDNISFSMDCFLASNGEFPPVVTSTTLLPFTTATSIGGPVMKFPTPDYSMKWIFHTCGAVGPEGPTPSQCLNSYRNSNVNMTVSTRGPFKGIQMWRVPETGTYRITAYGAAGGRSVLAMSRSHGVYITGDFLLRRGDLIYILVGQKGEDACPNSNGILNKICLEQSSPMVNKTQVKGGGGGGGGATYVFKVDKDVHIPLIIAAGGGGRGYSSQSKTQLEQMDYDPSQPGRNGKSSGGGGGWNDSTPVTQGGRPLVLGGQGGQACQKYWQTRGGFGGGGGGCMSGGGGGGFRGGNTSIGNNPKHDGDDGTSFLGPEGESFLDPLKAMEGDGEVIISPVENCSHCESGECHKTKDNIECYCDDDLILAPDGVSCINATVVSLLPPQPSLSHLALGLSVGTSALIAALLLAVSGVMIMYRRKHTELQSIQLELQSPDCKLSKLRASTIMTDYNPNYCFAGKTASVSDLKEVPRRNISLTRGLGHGAFGEVYEGLVVGIPGEPSPLQVAVKTLPEVCSEQDELDFLMEALIISKFSHQNIVRCVGVSLQTMPRFILLELMTGGDLKTFLRETRPRLEHPSSLTMVDLLNVARDIAKGCHYLEENQFIHRDIAARNCLLTCKGSGRAAKIGDFGMARDIYRASYYRKGGRAMLPVKWMPPEAFMEGIFTSKTDTWSFGVLLWEIFSLGYMPYPSRSNQEVLEFVTNGGRMDPPKNCPGPVYRIMTQSWQHQPEDRPNFSTILERIDYCLQDPDVVTMPLPVEYGPIPEEEERVPMRPDDPSAPTVLVNAQVPDGEALHPPPPSYPTEESRRGGEHAVVTSAAPEAKAQTSAQPQPYIHQHQQPHTQACMTMTTTNAVTSTAAATLTAKGPHVTTQPSPAEGGHINLAFTQGHPVEKDGHNGKSTSLWNPTYGSWFLQQQQRKQQQQQQQQQQQLQQQQQRQGGVGGAGGSGGRVPGEGQEHMGRTVAEVAGALGLQHQHKQFQHQLQQQHQLQLLHHQQQQQQGLCRPLLPPPPHAAQSPLLLDSAALPPVPLYRLRRFPCGNIGYGYQEQGLPPEVAHGNPNPPPPPPPSQQGTSMSSSAAHQRGASVPTSMTLGRPGMSEDSRPLLVTMGTVQDPRLPRMEGHNATVL